MDTSLWGKQAENKVRLNAPIALTADPVRAALAQLAGAEKTLGSLRGAFRSTPFQPEAGIPLFGLLVALGVLLLGFVGWLILDAHGGPGQFFTKMQMGGVVGVLVLVGIALGLIAFGGFRVRYLVRDLRQLFLVLEGGVVHVRHDGTRVFTWVEIADLNHAWIPLEYGGMDIGTEHIYRVMSKDGREVVLLGRSYPTSEDADEGRNLTDGDEPLTDVYQVGQFLARNIKER